MLTIKDSVKAYETWLKGQLGDELVAADLVAKHQEMKENPFRFLRATCWRWAEVAPELLPDLAKSPKVLSVNDAHVENFGLWRDAEGRLVFGVNDFDEGAPSPWPVDLVRLTASAMLACNGAGPEAAEVASTVLEGYRAGLENPHAQILDFEQARLRVLMTMTDAEEAAFWATIAKLNPAKPPNKFVTALTQALPPKPGTITFAPRRAGAGSLGRMRFVATAHVHGGPVAREAKSLVPSCWAMKETKDAAAKRLMHLATGPYRSPDPYFQVADDLIVRRLAPDSRKILFEGVARKLTRKALMAMARELAAIHRADKASSAIDADLAKQKKRWLERAATEAVKATLKDFKAFQRG
ncbi:MAG TPA: DUF2252 family protein [Caulobacteraceae bacterium]|jgi:hypothetical protein|nr:DUF2252 family protein [Caulobacteraceae bacterium]